MLHMVSETQLLHVLVVERWISAFAMPIQNRRDFLHDMVFSTSTTGIGITAMDVPTPQGEFFRLVLAEFTPGGFWKETGIGISSEWTPRNIGDELKSASHSALMFPPRRYRVFTLPELYPSS